MKTHAVKENRILKSFDFVLIFLTMSFVTFTILKSPAFFPDLFNHSWTGASLKAEIPIMHKVAIRGVVENTAQETTVIKADLPDNAFNEEKSAKAEIKSGTIKSNHVTAIKGGMQLEAGKADQSLQFTKEVEITENAIGTDTRNEKSMLEQWIISRDNWEQK
jgi:hypothetical protein